MTTFNEQVQRIEATLSDAIEYSRSRDEAISMAMNMSGNNTLYYDNGYHVKVNNQWVDLFQTNFLKKRSAKMEKITKAINETKYCYKNGWDGNHKLEKFKKVVRQHILDHRPELEYEPLCSNYRNLKKNNKIMKKTFIEIIKEIREAGISIRNFRRFLTGAEIPMIWFAPGGHLSGVTDGVPYVTGQEYTTYDKQRGKNFISSTLPEGEIFSHNGIAWICVINETQKGCGRHMARSWFFAVPKRVVLN